MSQLIEVIKSIDSAVSSQQLWRNDEVQLRDKAYASFDDLGDEFYL